MAEDPIELHATPDIEATKPTPGGFFEAFLESYKPPEEPFRVVMPGGEIFLFQAVRDSGSWTQIVDKGTGMAARLMEGVPVRLAKVASKDPQRNALAYVCCETMVGWYPQSKPDEETNRREPVGEMQPKWTYEEWLIFADKSPTMFDAIHEKVDKGQVGLKRKADQLAIRTEKKD